ncbi:hypothetical protein [Phenylobacterium sp.]|uniref:hypothetical protein n=1 Tax=Phenylobacterium sp. TaxID=1871053 RepID=UPI00286C69F0|nr:hypothetical protein [Phenylobacterium sp.]
MPSPQASIFAAKVAWPRLATAILLLSALTLIAWPARAVPSFAVQTGQPCQDCHVGGFGPQLTKFGREFKLEGYTKRAGGFTLPFSAMAVASYVRTRENQSAPPAAGFKRNDNLGLDQVSLFVAGGLGSHLGGFVQTTYDGIGKTWSWDNLDLRAVTKTEIKGVDVIFGTSLNNSPGTQDAWNSLPAWGFPYTRSALAPSPSASPLLAGSLAQKAIGLTAYAWINSEFYVEAGAYRSPSQTNLSRLGADPFSPGDIHGLAPYGRAAFQTDLQGGTLELGVFGMRTEINPGRDRSTGATDRYTDLGVDASFIRTLESGDVVTVNGRYIRERQELRASCILSGGSGACADTRLNDLRADASYYWRNKIGATVAVFDTFGPANPVIYPGAPNFKPDSSGVTFQLDGTPFGDGTSPFGPRANIRVGLQYTLYTSFDGARSNYDGAGANASNNNTARAFLWIAY